jgi:hypothetical protein
MIPVAMRATTFNSTDPVPAAEEGSVDAPNLRYFVPSIHWAVAVSG